MIWLCVKPRDGEAPYLRFRLPLVLGPLEDIRPDEGLLTL